MSDDIKTKIVKDLKKSGFYSEMKVIQEFIKMDWICSGAAGYYDLDKDKTREVDLDAYWAKTYDVFNSAIISTYHIIAEVKKSKKPWIVFKVGSLTSAWYKVMDVQNLISFSNAPIEERDLWEQMDENSLSKHIGWIGSTIHESFSKPDSPSKWYSAMITACKASEYLVNKYEDDRKKAEDFGTGDPNRFPFFVLVRPVVILDGSLFSAEISGKGQIVLDKIKYASINFPFDTAKYKRGKYRVDVVTIPGLEKYLSLSQKRLESIHDKIVRNWKESKVNKK